MKRHRLLSGNGICPPASSPHRRVPAESSATDADRMPLKPNRIATTNRGMCPAFRSAPCPPISLAGLSFHTKQVEPNKPGSRCAGLRRWRPLAPERDWGLVSDIRREPMNLSTAPRTGLQPLLHVPTRGRSVLQKQPAARASRPLQATRRRPATAHRSRFRIPSLHLSLFSA